MSYPTEHGCKSDLCTWGKWVKLEQSNFLISTNEHILSKISRFCEKVDFLCFLQEILFESM